MLKYCSLPSEAADGALAEWEVLGAALEEGRRKSVHFLEECL